jgi:NADH-ubiquinone oxidoreductase chain 5
LAILIGVQQELYSGVLVLEWLIYRINGMDISYLILLDRKSLIFIGVVMFISSIVLIYRRYYMSIDKTFYRFIILVYLFVLSMLLIVSSPNFISILLGWDGLGLVSYCLVIYYQREKSCNSGILTVLSNRVGDVAILLAIRWVRIRGRWGVINQNVFSRDIRNLILGLLIILASITKSAQVPFSAWLPAAIAAPTPVSSLVHSSTLVTAGVYLLIRLGPLIENGNYLLVLRVWTILLSGLGACFEKDIKKIIALSTLRQLGVIMFSLSIGLIEISFFHLLSHALFKSLLFLCAGLYIHGGLDQQDVRGIGIQICSMPVIGSFFFVANFSLIGFPFLSGFYSKDLIYEIYEIGVLGSGLFILILLSFLRTVIYRIRLLNYQITRKLGAKINLVGSEEPNYVIARMVSLMVLRVLGGSFIVWLFVPTIVRFLPVLGTTTLLRGVMGLTIVSLLFWVNLKFVNSIFVGIQEGLGKIWFLINLSTNIVQGVLAVGGYLIKGLDQGWSEIFGVSGVGKMNKQVLRLRDFGTEIRFRKLLLSNLLLITLVILML